MEPSQHEVEFEQRRLKPGALPQSLTPGKERFKGLLVRARLMRAAFVVVGAASIAFATQRAGIPLGGALCLFFVALPVLWVGGWIFGFLFQARRAARKLTQHVGSTKWQDELAAATVVERIKLSVNELGLSVTNSDGTQLIGWNRVRIERLAAGSLAVFFHTQHEGLALNESLNVPGTAFSSTDAFDAFCLEMQRHVWNAQR